MKEAAQYGIETICLHGGRSGEPYRAHLTPIYATSTYTFDSAEQAAALFKNEEPGYVYGRYGSPTIAEAEEKIALLEAYGLLLEDGSPLQLKAILFASGMAAISTMLLANLKAGDKIITHSSLYGGTQEMIDKILPGLSIEAITADFHQPENISDIIRNDPRIRLMYLETPANPTLQCIDMEQLCAIGKKHDLVVCADNTFATPYLQQPFRYQTDFVMHSTTKFLNGHGTAVGGILLGRDLAKMNGIVTKTHRLLGGNSNGLDAFLLVNGLRSFPLRMERHCDNAEKIAAFLTDHPLVSHVNFPGLPTHPHYNIARKQMKRPGAVLSFELKGGYEAGVRFLNHLKLCMHAVSLGTCDTLISHPASTTHVGVPRGQRIASGITDGLIRVSVGIETADDILNDLKQAIEA